MKLSLSQPLQLTSPRLPLAVYREIVAHLRQVEGIDAKLIMRSLTHDPTEKFDYAQSQVKALAIIPEADLTNQAQLQVNCILGHYAGVYAPWEYS
ncbi:MAG: hypothetical protein AAFQ80_14660 [Cyanobacteria bacterium J06621_8]